MNSEFIADIRNKLTSAKTALDLISKGKDVSKEFIEMALKDFSKGVELLNKLKQPR